MKTLFRNLLFLSCILTLTTCKKASKNVDDYYPVVSTQSANITDEGAVEVKANVSLKNGELHYIGFCMDTLPNPDMMKNQKVISELKGSEFVTLYDQDFNPAKTYYFRSWAASENGYSYGNVIQLSNIKAVSVVAPCTLNANSSNIGLMGSGSGSEGSVYKVSAVDHFSSTWDINCQGYTSSAGNLKLSFGSALKTKVFTTTEGSAYGDLVSISINSGFTDGRVSSGSKVYVNKISEGVFEITICSAPWKINGSSAGSTLNARFRSPF